MGKEVAITVVEQCVRSFSTFLCRCKRLKTTIVRGLLLICLVTSLYMMTYSLHAPICGENKSIIPNIDEEEMKEHLALPNVKYTDTISILVPLRDVEWSLHNFANMLNTITYPHNKVSVFFGEEGSTDNTYQVTQIVCKRLKTIYGFREAELMKINFTGNHISRWARHRPYLQESRRNYLSKVRNSVLDFGMRDSDWVLWLDSDIWEIPRNLVEQFLFANKDVMAVSCLARIFFYTRKNYDLNSARLCETGKIHLPDLRYFGRLVPLDIVGTSCLMVRSEAHRTNLRFPEKQYKGHHESEALGLLAKDLGYEVYGLPFVEVFHHTIFSQIITILFG